MQLDLSRATPVLNSFSCAGGILFTLHLLALFNYWGGHGRIWQFTLALSPTLGAWLVSVSRISGKGIFHATTGSALIGVHVLDGRHHGTDVIVGVLVGTVSGEDCGLALKQLV